MGTAPSGYQTPKIDWAANNVVTSADFNRIEGNINAIEIGSRTIDPAQVPSSNSGSLRQLLDWLANRIKAVTGKTNWYDTPDITLATLAAHKSRHASGGVDALAPADIGAVSKSGDTMTGLLQISNSGVFPLITPVDAIAESSAYPMGISCMVIGTAQTGWPTSGGSVVTFKLATGSGQRIWQLVVQKTNPGVWIRTRNNDDTAWDAFVRII